MVAINMQSVPPPPPPRKRAANSRTAVQVQQPETNADRRTKGLMGLGQLGQGLCLMTGQYADAATIGNHWHNIAPELANLSEEHDWLAKPIDAMIAIGPFGALLAAALPFALQIAANHKAIDAGKVMGNGIVPPEVLDAQMRAQVARMQADAMREQQQALKDAQNAQAEFEAMMVQHDQSTVGE